MPTLRSPVLSLLALTSALACSHPAPSNGEPPANASKPVDDERARAKVFNCERLGEKLKTEPVLLLISTRDSTDSPEARAEATRRCEHVLARLPEATRKAAIADCSFSMISFDGDAALLQAMCADPEVTSVGENGISKPL